MNLELRSMSEHITDTSLPEDVFGYLVGDQAAKSVALRHAYLRFAGLLHPDKHTAKDVDAAKALFILVTKLRDDAVAKIEAGTYGQRHVAAPAPPAPPAAPVVVTTKRDKYTVHGKVYSGDVADLLECVSEKEPERRLLFKIARSAADSDLMENEAKALAKIFPSSQEGVDDYRLLPRLVEAFVLKGSGPARRVNVFERDHHQLSKAGVPEHVSWAAIRKAYPKGLDFRDWGWMWKRALGGLGQAHKNGYVHGAVIPEHLLVRPDNSTSVRHGHGGKIVDWCYAVPIGEKAHTMVSSREEFYAPEFRAKMQLGPETDIYMLAQCSHAMLNADVPRQIRGLVESCLLRAPARRPNDAWVLLGETAILLKRIVGPPEYRFFQMSAT